jgi:hypothetical protein
MKTYRGNHPSRDWDLLGTTSDVSGDWCVYTKAQNTSDWLSVKVVAKGRCPGGANYWLSWSGTRLANGCDIARIAQHRPELLAAVRRLLAEREGLDLL